MWDEDQPRHFFKSISATSQALDTARVNASNRVRVMPWVMATVGNMLLCGALIVVLNQPGVAAGPATTELTAAAGSKNCGTHGSTASCPALDNKAYCGQSPDAKARFLDGTGCSCDMGYQYDATSHKCVDDPATLHSYCGVAWGDASKCTHGHCHSDGDCPKDASTYFASVTCPAPTPTPLLPPAPNPPVPGPKNCGTHGSTTSCPALDHKAYCGQSPDAKARFSDGTGCSCDTGYQYDATSHKCVDDPATLHNYCGASWGDASKCTHGHCHNDGDCPKDASTCFASVTCPL